MGNGVGYVMVLAAAVLWGSIGIFVNGLSAMGVTSMSMAAFRLLTGAAVMLPMLVAMGTARTHAKDPLAYLRITPHGMLPCALVGVVGLAMANCAYYESMRTVGMSTASVLLYTSPIFGCMLGRVLYREPMRSNKVAAIAVNVVGCVLAVTDGDLSSFEFSPYGVALGVFSGFLGALLAVFSSMATRRAHPLTVTWYAFVFGGLAMGAVSFPWRDMAEAMSAELVLLFAGFGLVPTALAYVLYMSGLARGLETSRVPVIASVETVVTVGIGVCAYAEAAGPMKVAGICLVLCSIVLMNMPASSARLSGLARHVHEGNHGAVRFWDRDRVEGFEHLADVPDWAMWTAPR